MRIMRDNHGKLSSTWYSKPTDTGLIMNFHALAPKKYKRSVVAGFVYRIHRACSSWKLIYESLEKAKKILERNQYPPEFYGPIIHDTLAKILQPPTESTAPTVTTENRVQKRLVFVQYRGKCTEEFAKDLHGLDAPCSVVMTLRKVKTVLPSLKPQVELSLRSGVVYQIVCSGCQASYVGQTSHHLLKRFKEHKSSGPVNAHFLQCGVTPSFEEHVSVLGSTSRGVQHLQTLEALWIREKAPTLNTRDEWNSRELTIKW